MSRIILYLHFALDILFRLNESRSNVLLDTVLLSLATTRTLERLYATSVTVAVPH